MNADKRGRIVIVYLIVALVMGCSTQTSKIPMTTLTALSSLTPSDIVSASPTRPPSSPRATSSPTQAPIPKCSGGNSPSQLPDTLELPGSILIKDESRVEQLSGVPLTTSPLVIKEAQDIELFGISPNGNWLTYSPYTRFQTEPRMETVTVVLLSKNGERIEQKLDIIHSFPEFGENRYPNALPIYWFGNWINDDLIYLQIYYLDAPGITKTIRLHAILDPFHGVWRNELLSGYPAWYERHFIGISPDLTRVLYIRSDPVEIVLWSIERQEEIWSMQAFRHASEVIMQWSPDSSEVAFFKYRFDNETDSHVYIADRDGNEVLEITDSSYPIPGFQAAFARWSPDSRYLAIAEPRRQPDTIQKIYIYDTVAGKFVNKCSITGSFDGLPKLQWSPDSKYLASFSSGTNLDTPIYIIDLENNQVFKLNQQGDVYGWTAGTFVEP